MQNNSEKTFFPASTVQFASLTEKEFTDSFFMMIILFSFAFTIHKG